MQLRNHLILSLSFLALAACSGGGGGSSSAPVSPASRLNIKHDTEECPTLDGHYESQHVKDAQGQETYASTDVSLKKNAKGVWMVTFGDGPELIVDGQNHTAISEGKSGTYAGACSKGVFKIAIEAEGKFDMITYSFDKDGNLVMKTEGADANETDVMKKASSSQSNDGQPQPETQTQVEQTDQPNS